MAAPSSAFHFTIFSALLLSATLFSSLATVAGGGDSWIPINKPACTGSLGECMMSEEFDMDSESNRRILATTHFLTYDAVGTNNPPCSHRGASYTNCQQGAEAHPYNRGCSPGERCRN